MDRLVGKPAVALLPSPPRREIPQHPRRILVIRPGGIGDAVQLIPTLGTLLDLFPGVTIDVLAERRNAGVFALWSGVGTVYRYDTLSDLFALLGREYDVVIDTEQWHRLSAVVARSIRARVSIGFGTNERKRLFTEVVPYSQEMHETFSFLNLLRPLGLHELHEIPSKFLSVPPSAKARATDMLGCYVTKPFVVLFPGASIPERRWGAERFRAVAEALCCRGIPIAVVGGNEDRNAGTVITAGNVGLDLTGRSSLIEAAAIIEKASVLVSGDSGLLHIGAALGIPTVSLFGPGRADKWAPMGESHIVINRRLPCSPCTIFGYTPRCTRGVQCMSETGVDEVAQSVLKLVQHQSARCNERIPTKPLTP